MSWGPQREECNQMRGTYKLETAKGEVWHCQVPKKYHLMHSSNLIFRAISRHLSRSDFRVLLTERQQTSRRQWVMSGEMEVQ